MKKYIQQLKGDLKIALDNLQNPDIFGALYGYGFQEGDLSLVPVKTLAAWLDIDLLTLPPADRLTEQQQIQIAKILLGYWTRGDELANVIRFAPPQQRYERAIEYLTLKGRYNGYGGFQLEDTPLTPEQWDNAHRTMDALLNNIFGKNAITPPSNTNNEDADTLPF